MQFLSGADATESFAGNGKIVFQKTFIHADDDVLEALAILAKKKKEFHMNRIAHLRSVYAKFIRLQSNSRQTLKLFKNCNGGFSPRNTNDSGHMPLTQAVLYPAIRRDH